MRLPVVLFLAGCAGPPPLDTSCPGGGSAPEALLEELAQRGIPGRPDTVHLRFGPADVLVGWKNLLSGRELTLSCAWSSQGDEWRLLHQRLDEGTHALRVSAREDPPGLIYRDARGRLLEVVRVEPLPDGRRTP